jgi:glycosyltransferase involved in cell wall biosynthesis
MATETLRLGLIAPDLSEKHGWGAYSLNLVRALRDAGAQMTIVAARNSPQIAGLDMRRALPNVVPRSRLFLPRMLAAIPAARAALKDCTLIHVLAEPYAPVGAAIAGKRPLFTTGHGSYVRYDRAFRPAGLYAWAFRRGLLVCVSRYTAQTAESVLPGLRTAVVNNGVNARRFIVLPPSNVAKKGPVVLTVGALKPRKGTLELVRAMASVVKVAPETECVIIGSLEHDRPYVARVRAEIARLGLVDKVHLLGQVSEETLLGWYGAADIFTMPSLNSGWRFEGFGLTLLEASAAGLPVIGTRGNGSEDAVDDGRTGFLVSQTDLSNDLASAILTLLADPDLAASMGAAGRLKASRQSWPNVARQMLALYNGQQP